MGYCSEQTFVLSEVEGELQEALEAKWPSCSQKMDSPEFWKHEWEKHGTCTGLAQRSYFERSLELLNANAANCADVTKAECQLCLTSTFKPCGGLQASEASDLIQSQSI